MHGPQRMKRRVLAAVGAAVLLHGAIRLAVDGRISPRTAKGATAATDEGARRDRATGVRQTVPLPARSHLPLWRIPRVPTRPENGSTPPAPARPSEHLFIGILYGPDPNRDSKLMALLSILKARQNGAVWVYTNTTQNKDYVIHLVRDSESLKQALYTEGAHVILGGHSNYGLGAVFATDAEMAAQRIDDIRYIDDDRILNYSSRWVSVRIYGIIEHQSFPNWQPILEDGTSGIMPYDFGDPRGDPAYNFYLTYQVPGDPTHYRVETVANSALQRFPSSKRPAWYSPDGSAPDPGNPDHRQYYITNTSDEFELTGVWQTSGYLNKTAHGDHFLRTPAGSGDKVAKWSFTIPSAGAYLVSAWWPADPQNTTAATFTVYHSAGSTAVTVDQTTAGGAWNDLGRFAFEPGRYAVVLSNAASPGTVVADAVRVAGAADPAAFLAIIENGTCPKAHYKNSTLVFRRELEVDPARLRFARMYIESCNSGLYFLDTFHRGVIFYTVEDSQGNEMLKYIKAYVQGQSDQKIWGTLQWANAIFDYYDFSRPPPVTTKEAAAAAGPTIKAGAVSVRVPLPGTQPSLALQSTIRALAFCPTEALLEGLATPELLADDGLLRRAVLSACEPREAGAVDLALQRILAVSLQAGATGTASRDDAWAVAKAILEAFPAEAVPRLADLYGKADVGVRANIVRVLGNIDGGTAVDAMLLDALEDKRACQDLPPDAEGEPLRLCDVAYNQLVQRYEMNDVLRTLGSMHSQKVRDWHIAVLLERIGRAGTGEE
jgi:hypothetical protein